MGRLLIILSLLASNAFGASWYLDNAASGANNGTSWTDAWQSFADVTWASVNPGDTVYISGGSTSKDYSGRWGFGGTDGTSGNRVYVRIGQDAGHNGVAIIDGTGENECIAWSGSSYLTLDGEYNGASHILLKNATNASRTIGHGLNGFVSNCTVRWITVSNCNNGIVTGQGTGNIIEYNTVIDIKGDAAIDLDGNTDVGFGGDIVRYNTIQCNTATDFSGVGPDGIQGTSSVDVYGNTFSCVNNGDTVGSQHPDAIQAGQDYWRIYGNVFENYTDSSVDMDCFGNDRSRANCYIYNNVFKITNTIFRDQARNPTVYRLYLPGSSITNLSNIIFANNTMVDYPAKAVGLGQIDQNCTFSNVQIVNNIYYNVGLSNDTQLTVTVRAQNYPTSTNIVNAADITLDYELIHAGSLGSDNIEVAGTDLEPAGWSTTWNNGNGVNSDPLFTSYTLNDTDNDYTLQSGSPARGAGKDMSAYFTTDFDGNTRSAWDIGAFEFQPVLPPAASGSSRRVPSRSQGGGASGVGL